MANTNGDSTRVALYSPEFLEKINEFKKDWRAKYKKISKEKTPQVDGTGKKIINKRPDGYDYIEESYMRECLDKHFPGWSLNMAAPLHFLGSEWIVAQVFLDVIDEYLIPYNISPPIRRFYGVDSVRIQYRTCQCKRRNNGVPLPNCPICKGTGSLPHNPENIVDVGDNCKQAVTAALKYAINRLTHIGDDVYGKRIEEEGAGSLEELVTMEGAGQDIKQKAFNELVKSKRLTYSKVFEILGIKSLSEITDYGKAYERIKVA